jgi:hypothetical protein
MKKTKQNDGHLQVGSAGSMDGLTLSVRGCGSLFVTVRLSDDLGDSLLYKPCQSSYNAASRC